MKVEIEGLEDCVEIHPDDNRENGCIFEVTQQSYRGALLMKMYSGWVDLRKPSSTFSNNIRLRGRFLPPGTVIKLTVE